jgi:hypothetical protein
LKPGTTSDVTHTAKDSTSQVMTRFIMKGIPFAAPGDL